MWKTKRSNNLYGAAPGSAGKKGVTSWVRKLAPAAVKVVSAGNRQTSRVQSST